MFFSCIRENKERCENCKAYVSHLAPTCGVILWNSRPIDGTPPFLTWHVHAIAQHILYDLNKNKYLTRRRISLPVVVAG